MIIKNKIKSSIKAKSKVLVFILMLIIFGGLFIPINNINAVGGYECEKNNPNNCDEQVNCTLAPTEQTPAPKKFKTTRKDCEFKEGVIEEIKTTQEEKIPPDPNNTKTPIEEKKLGEGLGTCVTPNPNDKTIINTFNNVKEADCPSPGKWTSNDTTPSEPPTNLFGKCSIDASFSVGSCITAIGYWVLVTIPSYILYVTAYLFNVMLALTLGTVLYQNNFLPEAWRIVRDFSNIFFILVLLFVSIKMILGLGGAEIKKMVVNVIIAALLINFSMFMTQVVIDSSNILALIFYNKINVVSTQAAKQASDLGTGPKVETKVDDAGPVKEGAYVSVVNGDKNNLADKDIAGGIVTGFNPAHFIDPSLGKKLNDKMAQNPTSGTVKALSCGTGATIGSVVVPGVGTAIGCYLGVALATEGAGTTLPFAIAIAIEVTAGAIYLFASWAFFVAGLAFIARLIELWVLIIFSPFAFMSLSIPQLQDIEYLGWNKWLDRLLRTAFMAPIFMFFLLLIVKLVQIDILKDVLKNDNSDSIPRMLFILTVPALIYLSLLYKATDYAKKGAGEIGETVIKYGKIAAGIVGGIALTAASGGASVAIGGGLGAIANKAGGSARLKDTFVGNKLKDFGGFLQKSTFDPRNIKALGKYTDKAGLGKGREGSWNVMKEKQMEKRQKRAEVLEKRGTAPEKKAVDEAEIKIKEKVLQDATINGVTLPAKLHLENVDKEIDKARIEMKDAVDAGDIPGITIWKDKLNEAKRNKAIIRGASYTNAAGVVIPEVAGGIASLERERNKAKVAVDVKSEKITSDYAKSLTSEWSKIPNQILKLGAYSRAGADEVARKIRTGTKLDSGEKPK